MTEPPEIVVSPDTFQRMSRELEELTTTGREEMGERLRRAREFGDIRENADFDAARDAQGLMEARIRQLQHMVNHAVVRDGPIDVEAAGPGVIVSVREDGAEDVEDYLLASSAEEKIEGITTATTSSPLGLALAGRKVGERALVKAPGGDFSVEIVGLRPA